MPTNDFIGFASSGSANIMSQADFAAAAEQSNGVQPGPATSALANKIWRQGSNMAAALGDLMSAQGYDALDDGDISKLAKNLSMAVALTIEYNATYDFKSGSICRYNGDLYIALIDNGPSSSVKAPTDVTAWAKIILTTATQSAAGYMSAEDKTALDNVPTTYFPLAGGTITGQTKIATSNNGPGIFQIANSSITKGTAPNNAVYASLGFFGDSQTDYTRRLGVLETVYNPDKSVSVLLGAYKANTATDTEMCTISCNIDAAGNVATYAPTPATSDVSTKIATTAYVDARASNVQAKNLSPTSAVTTPHYSSCAVQNHVCFVELSFDLAATPANWTKIKIFDLPVTPTMSATGMLNNQDGSVGGLFFEARTDGGLYMRFTGGSLPTNTYYHGGIVFPC